jgi:hypothetical protein
MPTLRSAVPAIKAGTASASNHMNVLSRLRLRPAGIIGGRPCSAKRANLAAMASPAYVEDPGAALTAIQRPAANSCAFRLMSCGKYSRARLCGIFLP